MGENQEEKKDEIVEIEENTEGTNDGIKISNDVVAVIAGVAVSEVPGVASMSGGFAGGISEVLSGKKNLSKGIKVDAGEKEVKIDVNIIVEYGSRIPDVAFEIQNRVKKSVENMTGLKVSEVNVHVQGVRTEKEEKTEPKVLRLPEKYQDSKRVIQYLFNRGIDYQIIQECIADGVIFESNGRYHNAVFVGKDETGTPKYAAYRGLGSSTFKGDAYGSDKQYSFRLLAKEPCQSVHLFEAAIDLLSYATLLKAQGKDYKAENLLSLSGVYQPKKENKDSKIPIALSVFLEKNPLIKTIHLHLDNDKTGRLCANTLKELLRNKYEVFDEPPKKGKDYNDYLCIQLGIYKSKERSYER